MEVQNNIFFADICSIAYSHWPSPKLSDWPAFTTVEVRVARLGWQSLNQQHWSDFSADHNRHPFFIMGSGEWERPEMLTDDFSPLLSVLHFAEVRMNIS